MRARRHSKRKDYSVVKKQSNSSKWLVLIGFGLIFLMVFSGVFLGGDSAQEEEYNGYSFFLSQQGWVTTLQGQQVGFQYLPSEVEFISVESFSLSSEVYVGFDPSKFSEDSFEVQQIRSFLQLSG